jgi:hypothetical protein
MDRKEIRVDTTRRAAKGMIVTALAALAVLALGAGSASASVAKWTPEGSTQWSASSGFTLKQENGTKASCLIASTELSTWAGSAFESNAWLHPGSESYARCNGSSTTNFTIIMAGSASLDTGTYHFTLSPIESNQSSPWGTYREFGGKAVGTYTNGSGSTASTLTFNEQKIGTFAGGWLYLTGTFKVTTGSGGLMTLV